MRRRLVYLASVAVVVWALAVVPMPFVAFTPGEAIALGELVEVGESAEPLNGDLAMLTVRVKLPGMLGLVLGAMDGDVDLIDLDRYLLPGETIQEHFEGQQGVFGRQTAVSAAVALAAAGFDVDARELMIVRRVVEGTPADGVLEVGDVLLLVGDEEVSTFDEVLSALHDIPVGTTVPVTVLRDDEEHVVPIVVDLLPGEERVGLGVELVPRVEVAELPLEVNVAGAEAIGGPSAGLMIALTIYDLVSEDDLARGRRIAGTGTIDLAGRVGAIGGIRQKVVGAQRDGADLVLVPASQLNQAQSVGADIEIIGVSTFDDALEVLRR